MTIQEAIKQVRQLSINAIDSFAPVIQERDPAVLVDEIAFNDFHWDTNKSGSVIDIIFDFYMDQHGTDNQLTFYMTPELATKMATQEVVLQVDNDNNVTEVDYDK